MINKWDYRRGLLVAIFAFGSVLSARADTLREDLKPLAEEILKTLEAEKQDTIAVGDFVGIAGTQGSAGPGIAETLKSLLEELKPGVVKRRAAFSLRGRYDRVADPRSKDLIVIKITAEITDDKANRIDEKFVEIRDTATIAMLLNVTVALPPLATRDKRNEAMKKAFDEPKFQPAGTIIKAKPDSPFAIELLVTTKDKAPKKDDDWAKVPARAPAGRDEEAFVDIKRDEVYAVKVHNGSKREAAITLRIDGIDVFHFSEVRDPKTNAPKYKHFIVQPGETIIPGWHKSNDRADSFLVTEYGKSAAAEEPNLSRGKIGVVTVTFALAWEGDKMPDEEKGTRDGGNATGFGPPLHVDQKEVERRTGVVRDVISVRYTR